MDKLALVLLIIGGLNWGVVGIFGNDLFTWMFGSYATIAARIIYIVVALAACWAISMLFRRNTAAENY